MATVVTVTDMDVDEDGNEMMDLYKYIYGEMDLQSVTVEMLI